MSQATPEQTSGWRGRKQTGEEAAQHRWQTGKAEPAMEVMPGGGRRRGILIAVFLLGAAALLTWYVRSLLIAPEQTPVLIVTAAPYPAPFGPNAWSREDAGGIAMLNGKTARVVRMQALQELERQLESLGQTETVVIVLSMHGGVNDSGAPCLIPPTAPPTDASTWVPFREVLKRIRAAGIPDRTNKLLVLDCNRVRVRWQQGTLYNAFTEKLLQSRVVQKSGIPNLVAINSASSSQRGWASADLQATVFGHFLRLGLAGRADAPAEGGNGDRSVSLQELFRFVAHHTDHWVRHHRAERQTPLLISADDQTEPDFHVAWALRGSIPEPDRVPSAVTDDQIDELWQRHDRLRRSRPYAGRPALWSQFQRKLLRLEAVAVAGSAYADQARSLRAELSRLADRLESGDDTPRRLLADVETSPRLPSLVLAESFGQISTNDAQGLRAELQRLQREFSPDALAGALNGVAGNKKYAALSTVQLLQLIHKYRVAGLWPSRTAGARVLSARVLADRVSAPLPAELHDWIRSRTEQADADRRLAEDVLFIGPKHSAENVEKRLKAAEEGYGEASATTKRVADLLALEQRACAETPWLACWLSRTGTLLQPAMMEDHLSQVTTKLVRASGRLSRSLLERRGTGEPAEEVAALLEELANRYDDECLRLAKQKPTADAAVLRRIRAALSVPLIPGRERQQFRMEAGSVRSDLRRLAKQIAENLRRSDKPVPASDAQPGQEPSEPLRRALRLTVSRWDAHPAVSLLKPAPGGARESAAGPLERTLASQRELRALLDGYDDQLKSARTAPASDVALYRRQWREAARVLRCAGCVPLPATGVDPVEQLERYDLHRMLLWQARRAADDFLASVDSAGTPYFHTAASNCMATSSRVFPGAPAAALKSLRELLERRRRAAARGLSVRSASNVQLAPGEPLTIQTVVDAGGAAFPSGRPAFYIRGAAGRVPGTIREIALKGKREADKPLARFSSTLSGAVTRAGTPMTSVVLYRGHEFRGDFIPNMSSGVVVEFAPRKSATAKIAVSGDRERAASIVFVLDCSQSMSRRTQAKGTRMAAAKDALAGMLAQLAKRGNARVGAILYGHRVGWDAESGKEIVRRRNYPRKIPENLLPLEDAEVVLSLGRFDATIAAGVEGLIKDVKPWGETPLYLAIRMALRQFAGEPAGSEKRIIVITDGVNNQRVPPGLVLTKSQQEKLTTLSAVTASLTKSRIPVHLLAFEMTDEEQREAKGDFLKIAAVSGGSHLSAIRADTLLSSLKGLFGPDRFRVESSSGGTVAGGALSETVEVPLAKLPAGEAAIVAGSARMSAVLSGGESLQLELSADGGSIRARPYLIGDPKFVAMSGPAGQAATGLKAGVHAPVRSGAEGRDVRFTISLQRDDGGLARRPAAVWVEITPQDDAGEPQGAVRTFFDPSFAEGKPVPCLSLLAGNWPAKATRASVEFWIGETGVRGQGSGVRGQESGDGDQFTTPPLTTHHSPLTKRVTLAELLKPNASLVVARSGVSGSVSETTSGQIVRIVQRAGDGQARLVPLRVNVSSPAGQSRALRPQRIVRRYDFRHKVGVHDFMFAAKDRKSLEACEVHLTDRNTFRARAIRTTRAVTVSVPSRNALLRLNGSGE